MTRIMARSTLLVVTVIFSSLAHANVVGSDSQNFNTVTDGLDFVTVHSSQTLKPGIINFGLFLNYAVNTLPYQVSNTNQNRTNFNDSLLGMDFNMGIGLMNNWDAGISFPQILSQSVESSDGTIGRGQFANNGLTEIRANTKYRLLGDDTGGLAAVASFNLDQTADNPFAGQNAGPTFNFELAADHTFGEYRVAGNIGYRARSPGNPIPGIGIVPYGDQFIASVAANYLIKDWDTKVIGEIFGGFPTNAENSQIERQQSSLELLLGLKHDLNSNLAAHAGAGTEVMHGNASPDWRVYVGLNYTIGPLFAKMPDVVQASPPPPPEATPPEDPFEKAPTAPVETFVMRNILFEFDSDRLAPSSMETLDRLAGYLKKPPYFKQLDISGHTDSIGSAVYNLDLSQRRARSVRRYLIERDHLPSGRIFSYGYGEGVPIADNGNYQGRALNRRVEFKITRDFDGDSGPPPTGNTTVTPSVKMKRVGPKSKSKSRR